MSEKLDRGAEIAKLARLLDRKPADLDYLERLPASALRRFREQATDKLYDSDGDRLRRVAASSKLVPIPLTVQVVQKAVGPLGAAALSGLVDPDRAVKIAEKLPLDFLAEVAIDMDPRRSTAVIAKMPPATVAAVGETLIGKGEHVTMGRFVGFLPRASLEAAVKVIGNADMLRTAFVLEDKSRLNDLAAIAEHRLPGIVQAAHENDLWGEALDLLDHLDATWQAKLGDVVAQQDHSVVNSLIEAAHRTQAFDSLLPATAVMSHDTLLAFAEANAVHQEPVLREIVRVALASNLWQALLPLAGVLPARSREIVAARVAEEPDSAIEALADTAHTHHMWDSMLPIALGFTAEARSRLANLPLLQRSDVLAAIIEATARNDLWAELLPLADALPAETRPHLAACIGDLSREQMLAAVTTAARSGNIPTLVEIALQQSEDGRKRVLDLIDGLDNVDEFVAALTPDTPQVVWDALVRVKAEIPGPLADKLAERARACGNASIASALVP